MSRSYVFWFWVLMFFGFDRNLFQVFRVYEFFGFVLFQGLVVWGFQGLIVWGVAVFGEYSRGCSLSLSPIGAGMTGPLSGPVSDRESVRRRLLRDWRELVGQCCFECLCGVC